MPYACALLPFILVANDMCVRYVSSFFFVASSMFRCVASVMKSAFLCNGML